MKQIRIKTSKSYDYLIGNDILDNIVDFISATMMGKLPGKVAIITDETVEKLYVNAHGKLVKNLTNAGIDVFKFAFPCGENAKNMQTVEYILQALALSDVSLGREDLIIAVGGGVVGDIAGFIASIYLRGINYINIPTTLLAAVDSSIGGKTGVNLKQGKNLAGSFWQPSLVVFDMKTLKTLPADLIAEGLVEAIKCGIIADRDLFEHIDSKKVDLSKNEIERKDLKIIVSETVGIKKAFVEVDEFDTGSRMLLNFGHTIGHAIEKCSDYSISHGRAVAMGMCMILKMAVSHGICEEDFLERLEFLLKVLGFNLDCPFSAKHLMTTIVSDKKRSGDFINLVFPVKLGKATVEKIKLDEFRKWLEEVLE